MKNPSPGMRVTHYGRVGVVAAMNEAGHCVVRFPSPDDFPFPELRVVRIAELKRCKNAKQTPDHEPALF